MKIINTPTPVETHISPTIATENIQHIGNNNVATEGVLLQEFSVIDPPVTLEELFEHSNSSLSHSLNEIDEWALAGDKVDDILSKAPQEQSGTQFLPANAELDNQLYFDAGLRKNQPDIFFGFIAKNTNPRRMIYLFQNIVNIITEFLNSGKVNMVVERNCVHCTQAVDKTLAQFLSPHPATPQLFQVKNAGKGEFLSISLNDADFHALTHENNVLDLLKSSVPPNKRACFSVPVAGKPYSHAMNYVRYDANREFIICGQTGTVYDMAITADRDNFTSHYGVEKEGGVRVLQVIVTGDAP